MKTNWTPFSVNLLKALKDPSAASIKDKMLKNIRDEANKHLVPKVKKPSTKLH
jgi:hypothetical protein